MALTVASPAQRKPLRSHRANDFEPDEERLFEDLQKYAETIDTRRPDPGRRLGSTAEHKGQLYNFAPAAPSQQAVLKP